MALPGDIRCVSITGGLRATLADHNVSFATDCAPFGAQGNDNPKSGIHISLSMFLRRIQFQIPVLTNIKFILVLQAS